MDSILIYFCCERSRMAHFEKNVTLNFKCGKTNDLTRFTRAFKSIWLGAIKIDLKAKAILLITLLSCFCYVNSLSTTELKYLHSTVGFNDWLLNSTQLTVSYFSHFWKPLFLFYLRLQLTFFFIYCSASIKIFFSFCL